MLVMIGSCSLDEDMTIYIQGFKRFKFNIQIHKLEGKILFLRNKLQVAIQGSRSAFQTSRSTLQNEKYKLHKYQIFNLGLTFGQTVDQSQTKS